MKGPSVIIFKHFARKRTFLHVIRGRNSGFGGEDDVFGGKNKKYLEEIKWHP
jgi:hypothetical protein